jgi:hypothetical protein
MSALTVSGQKFRYETDNEHFCAGSSLRGYVSTTYYNLVEKFGEPIQYGEGDKVTVEWVIEFMNEETYELEYATIYDWKQYEEGTPYDLYNWHIGGYSQNAVELINAVMGAV